MSRSGFKYILSKHVKTAAIKQSTLSEKRVIPHTLRDYVCLLTMSGNMNCIAGRL
jgi:integrase/recombinase XerD